MDHRATPPALAGINVTNGGAEVVAGPESGRGTTPGTLRGKVHILRLEGQR
jgi:hypothetical protein